jgi:hypothetical protein
MTVFQITLGHANSHWDYDRRVDPIPFDPRVGSEVTALMDYMTFWRWKCENPKRKCTQKAKL